MREARTNPRAIAAAQRPAFKPESGKEVYGFGFEATVELNQERAAELVTILDAAKAEGQDPRFAIPKWNPKDNPEFFDYVVYNKPTVGRPSPLAIDQNQVPTAFLRWSEHLRIPLPELRARADLAFGEAEAAGESRQ